MAKNEVDMLHGPIAGKIIAFALPVASSSILQQLFNAVDVIVVGRFAGSEALAAVGANTTVISLILNLFIGITLGTNAIIARHIGMRDEERIRIGVSTSAGLAILIGVFLLALGLVVSRPLLTLMATPANILEQAVLYLRIYMLGAPFIMIFNFGAAILRSKGDTKRPLYILTVAGVINMLLDLALVIFFGMGVEGVAIATTVSNIVSAAAITVLLLREEEPFRLKLSRMRPEKAETKAILSLGLPAGFQSMLFSISNVFVQSAVNAYGSDAIAGNSSALIYESIAYLIVPAFSSAAMTFISQNYAAGQFDRCRKIFSQTMLISTLATFVVGGTFVLLREPCMRLFSADSQVITYGKIRMETALSLLFLCNSYEIASAAMRGYGQSLLPALLTVFGTCVLRLVWIYLVCPVLPGFRALILAYPVSWVITGAMVLFAYWITSMHYYRESPAV